MKEFTIKIITKSCFLLKNMIVVYNQSHDLLKIAKEIFVFLLYIFIIALYYIYISTYKFSDNNYELINLCTVNFEESKPVIDKPNIWYKYILDDFFNKFTSNSKTINYKVIEIKPDCAVKTLMPLEHNLGTTKKPVILNKIQSNYVTNIISECEYSKNRTILLEIQLLNTKIACHNLIKDVYDITKEMRHLIKKP